MKSITLHNIPAPLAFQIKEEARKRKLSLNKTIQHILHTSFGMSMTKKKKSDFSDIFGVWSEKEAKEFDEYLKTTNKIDWDEWK